MGSLKLKSFEDFTTASVKAATLKLEEEQSAARNKAADQFKTLLAEFGVTSIKDLNEEDRNSFYRKLGASEISESIAIIEEGTRSQIGIINKRGKIESVYMHYDGYPDHMLPVIKKSYMNVGAVKNILKKGGASYLKPKFSEIEFYGDKVTMKGDAKDVAKYIKNAEYDGGAEYVYLYDERDGKWYMADTYAEPRELKPAFEHLVINEKFVPSRGNVKDAKKVAKTLEGIMIEGSALTGDETTHLGAIKYLLMEALQDANFHSYIEPVGKALGGKIRTVMIKVENLGGMELPVGAKTIKRFLDDNYVKISSAAGWSGIGIVEGIALYLDGWGLSKHAQKIVDAFNLIYQNEAIVNEGNAFFSARAKAMEEGADEFEFNGKTFPLTKEEEEVEEGNAFGAARAEAIAKGDDKFKVGDEEYDVEGVDADDKENAEEYAEEEGIEVKEEEVTEDEIEIKVDGDYEIEVEKEDDEEEESEEEVPAEEEKEEVEEADTVEAPEVNEAEVKSDEDFKEYAFSVLGKAFGDKFDEEKAQEVVDGLLDKHGDDYGAAVGALQSSLG
tara:strand:- start:575 stop:2248 length:1674 start_codon:yes stop_codon:yes gene_type:complete